MMAEKNQSIAITLQKIRDRYLFIRENAYKPFSPEDEGKVGFHIRLDYQLDSEAKLVEVILKCLLTSSSEFSQESILIEYAVSFDFFIENFSEATHESEGMFYLSEQVLIPFVNISVSSLRGIMREKVAGTSLKNLILPIVNPADLIKSTAKRYEDELKQRKEKNTNSGI